MKSLLVFLVSFSAIAQVSIAPLRSAKFNNLETIQDAFDYSTPSRTYYSYISANTDVFSAKTNKYAESHLISIIATGSVHIRFGGSDVSTATSADFYLPANTEKLFKVNGSAAYIRVIPTSGSAGIYATELY